MARPVLSVLTVVAASAIGLGGLTGCGADEDRTALAVRSTRWNERAELTVTVECAEVTASEVRPGAGVEGLPLVTLWGRPKFGRCHTEVTVPVPGGTTRIDDAATGRVVDLPPCAIPLGR